MLSKYIHEAYEEVLKKMPKVGALVSTPEGRGYSDRHKLVERNGKIKLENENENEPNFKILYL